MSKHRPRNGKWHSGIMTVELAIVGPLLVLMMAGAADFARVFYHAITLANASGTGSFYGSQNNIKAVSYDTIKEITADDATNLDGVSVMPDLYCDCPVIGSGDSPTTCDVINCGSYGSPRVYSKVVTQQTFAPLLPWPGIPNPVVITRETYSRVP